MCGTVRQIFTADPGVQNYVGGSGCWMCLMVISISAHGDVWGGENFKFADIAWHNGVSPRCENAPHEVGK